MRHCCCDLFILPKSNFEGGGTGSSSRAGVDLPVQRDDTCEGVAFVNVTFFVDNVMAMDDTFKILV